MRKIKAKKGYVPPGWDEWFMRFVYLAADKSKDPRTKIGAVLVRDKHIISTGYNGFPIGVNDTAERYDDREVKYKYVAHAEDNAVLSAARFGISTLGSTLYTQGIPCNECCKSVIQGGIKEVVVHKQWPATSPKWKEAAAISSIMLKEAGIKVRWLNKSLNVFAFSDGNVVLI